MNAARWNARSLEYLLVGWIASTCSSQLNTAFALMPPALIGPMLARSGRLLLRRSDNWKYGRSYNWKHGRSDARLGATFCYDDAH